MPTKIRLSRHGRMRKPFYYIVVADSRAPRDGRFIERIGSYNPTTNPATIDLDFDKALDWVQKGAQPTDTCRAILSYKGVMYKKHLLEGVKKGAFPETVAEERFNNWMSEKEAKIQAKRDSVNKAADDAVKSRLEVEKKINEERAQELAKRKMAEKEAEVVAEAEAAEGAEEAPAETKEATAAEEPAEAKEVPAKEPSVEAKETPKEETQAEVEETPEAEKPVKAEEKAPVETEKKPVAEEPAEKNAEGEEPKAE